MDFPVSSRQFDETHGVHPVEYDSDGIPRGGPANYPGLYMGAAGDQDSYEGNFDAQTGEPRAHLRRRADGIVGPALMFVDTDLQTAT
ncbi:hypothetical protein IWW55_005809, partial [Coemansia sp. RSA 2706]